MKTINIFKTTSLIITMCLFSSSIISQNHKKQIQKIKIDENRESNEAVKIAFFTSKMQLTTIESQNFWPVVNEMEAELKALKDKFLDDFFLLSVRYFVKEQFFPFLAVQLLSLFGLCLKG